MAEVSDNVRQPIQRQNTKTDSPKESPKGSPASVRKVTQPLRKHSIDATPLEDREDLDVI